MIEIRPFTEDAIEDAGRLLAARHAAHRRVEPLLPARYEDPDAAAAEVAALWESDGASGAIASRGGRAVGYLLGTRGPDRIWGRNAWVGPAGHAAVEAENVRDLYALAAARWVEEGRHRHYALAPASDAALVDAWFRLSFGLQHVHALRELPAGTALPAGVREAREEDVEALAGLAPLLPELQARSPVFAPLGEEDPDELRAGIRDEIADGEVASLVVERGGEIVGGLLVVPVERSGAHAGLARPEGLPFLAWAATRPEVRGSGAGLALTDGAFAWARARGHEAMVVDWRSTNLLASRFWPARGFRPTFLRLYRAIP